MASTMTAPSAQEVLDEDLFGVRVPPLDGYRAKQCPVRLQKDLDDNYDEADKDPDPAQTVFIMAEGVEFESAIGAELAALHQPMLIGDDIVAICDGRGRPATKIAKVAKLLDGVEVLFVPDCDRSLPSKKRREIITEAALDAGVRLVWNARLPSDGERAGEPDYLVRIGAQPNANGKWGYAPCDVKHHAALDGSAKPRPWPTSTLASPWFETAADTVTGPGTPRLDDAKQLCHYTYMLDAIGHAVGGSNIGAIVGKGQVAVWYDLDDALHLYSPDGTKRSRHSAMEIYRHEFTWRREVARRTLERNAGSTADALVAPEWKSECGACPWRTVCHDELREERHITLLPGITPARAKAHYDVGVTTIESLARLDVATAVIVDSGADPALVKAAARNATAGTTVAMVLSQAGAKNVDEVAAMLELCSVTDPEALRRLDTATAAYHGTGVWRLARSIDQARVTLVERVHRARGVDSIDMSTPTIELHFDVENDGPYVYLIRFVAVSRSRSGRESKERVDTNAFTSWDQSPEGEAKVFADTWEYVRFMQMKAKRGKYSLRWFHYTAHERGVFKSLAERHAGFPGVPTVADVEAWFDSFEVVDLHEVLSDQLVWPTENVTLKTLAKYVKFVWRDDDPSGANSIVWYRNAIDPELSEAEREEWRARVLDYNEDDCLATAALVEFITRLGETRKPASKLPPVEDLDRRFRRRRRTAA